MDDQTAFVELSPLLTGLNDPAVMSANAPFAEEYARRLRGTFALKFPALLQAYVALASASPKPAIDDNLLAQLRATTAFKDNEIVAKQIVNVWYFSQFNDESGAHLIDGGYYEKGEVWSRIKAHPIGFSSRMHGYWARKPVADAG
jgi:hypothetical protein